MVRIILVRHGETTWNKEGRYQGQIDTPLSERGLAQGKAVAEALKEIPIDLCYVSTLSRAKDTAGFCMAYHDGPVYEDERLLEINHGLWEGKLAVEIGAEYPEMLQEWRTKVVGVTMPEGESITTVRDRAMAAFRDYAEKHDGKTILVVAHDAVNKAVLCDMLDIGLDHFWQVKQDNTCINVVEYSEGKWRLVLMNSTAHLGFLFSGIEQKGL
ncbi:MAG: histidine phosphatase family protein [Sporomusaceae bacterium]|nr:histidine phosphatase family protein [Sporomusaceae bacterium]